MKKGWGFILRLTVSVAALAGLGYALRGKLGEAFLVIKEGLEWPWFLIAIIGYFLGQGLISWRLQLVFRVQGVRVNYPQSFYLAFLGHFFNLFFPSALGGDVAKAYFAYQYSGKKLGSLTGVVLDRLLGFVTLVLIGITAFAFYSRSFATPIVSRSLYGALGVLIFGTIFFSSRRFAQKFQFLFWLIPSAKWREKLSDLYHAIRNLQHHPFVLVSSLALSLVAQFLFIGIGYLLSLALGIDTVSLGTFFVLMPLVGFVSMAPSLSGLGVREAGFVFLFKSWMPVEKAFAVSLVYDLILYGYSFLAGLVFAFRGGLRKETLHGLEAVEKLQEVGRD